MTLHISETVFSPWLTPVRLVSTSNISGTYNNGPNNNGVDATLTIAASSLTIDSILCMVGDRVMLQTQTNVWEQGIYIVRFIGTSVILQRSFDQQNIEQLKAGENVAVGAGSVYAGDFYTLIEPLPQNIGVDAFIYAGQADVGGVSFSGGASTANALAVFSDTAGNIKAQTTTSTLGFGLTAATGNFTATTGSFVGGSSGHASTLTLFPSSASNGTLIVQAINAGGAFNTTIASGTIGQSSVITIPDPGAATANFMLDAGTTTAKTITTLTSTTANITNLKYGATPVAQIDPASCTIVGAAGASNVCNVTIQLKDGSGTNMARILPFRVYASSAADGLTLASVASTGFAVSSGGLSLQNGAAVTTQISAMSSATGGCVLTLTDTGKQTSYLVLVLANGCKISAQLSSGSYGA